MSLIPVDVLRRLWRRLPMAVRRNTGQAILRTASPWLAARLPRAMLDQRARHAQPTIMGVFHAALGHGTAARLLTAELEAAGLAPANLDVTDHVGADANDPRALPSLAQQEVGPLILAMNPDTALVALAANPRLLQDRPVIGYFVWELETAPASWRRIGPALHALWSPSRFSAAALEALYHRPVHVVPHPAALAPPPSRDPALRAKTRAALGAHPDDFIGFMSFSATSSLARKNPFAAIEAFESAFGGAPSKRLVLRCLGGHRFPEALTALRQAVRNAKAAVTLIDEPQGFDELQALYAACDVYVSLHRSEGFGLNLAEAMLAGLPVLATGWSGNLDFMDPESAALVSSTLVPVSDPQGIYRGAGARWAEPSLEEAVTHLRALANDPALRARIGDKAAQGTRQRLSGGAAAEALSAWGPQ